MGKRSMVATLTTASALVVGVMTAAPGAFAAPAPKAIPNTRPAWVSTAQHLGHASAKAAVTARVYLAPRGGVAALQQAALAVSTPGTAAYKQFLTPTQYTQRYAPDAKQLTAVKSWLTSAGLRVSGVEAQNRYLSVQGTVAAAQKAFGTPVDRYRHDGQVVQAPAAPVKVPAALATSVLTVTGLDTSAHKNTPNHTAEAPPPDGYRNARPCSTYFGQLPAKTQADYKTPLPKYNGKYLSYAPCGYTGPQLRAAYEGATDLDGTGVTVAITDAYAAPTIAKDAKQYARDHGDGGYAKGQLTQVKQKPFTHQADCDPSGWYGEETLDVEAVHALAPGAHIAYYGAASCYDDDLLTALAAVVDDNKAQLVSNSWGDLEQNASGDTIAAYEQIFLQGAMQGISFMFSSGDNGDELASSGIKQTDYPTSDPFVTSVGGTSAAIGADGSMTFEAGWGTNKYGLSDNGKGWTALGYLYGAGGGTSSLFNQPDYQAGVAPGPYRTIPDIAMDADPNTGMLVGETQTFPGGAAYGEYRIGGTSLASPLFAGMTALALQHSGSAAGLLNPVVYSNADSGVFTDVKGAPKQAGDVRVDFVNGLDATDGLTYSIRTFGQDSSLKVARGWDNVTGVGTPTGSWLTAIPSSVG